MFQGFKDAAGQVAAKLTGLAVFSASSMAGGTAVRVVSNVVTATGAVSGAVIAVRIARHQFGTDTAAARAATALSAVAGAGLGAAITVGHAPAALALEWAVLEAGFLIVMFRCFAVRAGDEGHPREKAVAALAAVGVGAIGYALHGHIQVGGRAVGTFWRPSDPNFMARQSGVIFEAILVECFKDALSGVGSPPDRRGLTLEGRISAAAKGLPAYVAASVFINGLAGTSFLPETDGLGGRVHFSQLAPTVLLGCLPNWVRGTANFVAVEHSWGYWRKDGEPANPLEYRPKKKELADRVSSVLQKSAVRFTLIAGRNAVYASLREMGFSMQGAALWAQGIYAVFAQYRDLYADLMSGEGWTPALMPLWSCAEPPSAFHSSAERS
ncbi:MAG TPA: hypothetical protein VHA82_19425 [Ramlibacter sp.]|uniref:hypothetical protein n=1 Tax=Ramlibacter sp. TaxID=1917967 RepID=UPI002C3E9024|nr:hypothetical protein [Ramlibacter sp.]HVZ45988.1 hypothetical protein [Ramlibacter sp.]